MMLWWNVWTNNTIYNNIFFSCHYIIHCGVVMNVVNSDWLSNISLTLYCPFKVSQGVCQGFDFGQYFELHSYDTNNP
jgi:hypothetical protein